MAFEDLLLTSQYDDADRQRAVIAQGMRTFPEANVMKKVMEGPFKLHVKYDGDLPAVPGYRYFIHTAFAAAVNTAATACKSAFWYGYSDGVQKCLVYVGLVPNADNAPAGSFVCDVFMDENTAVMFATDNSLGPPVDSYGIITYCLVKVGDD